MLNKRVSDRRTQVYLPEELYQMVVEKAAQRGVSMAQVIREAVEKIEPREEVKARKNDPIWDLVGMIKGEPADFSSNTRGYLREMYRAKK